MKRKDFFDNNSIFQEGKFFRGFLVSSANPKKEKFAIRDTY